MPSLYGLIIDKDHIAWKDAKPGTNCNAKSMCGPRGIPMDLYHRLMEGEGKQFRMYDDGNLYYEGRIIYKDDADGEVEFAPLNDFGTPNAGAVTIKYLNDGRWEVL